MGVVNFLFALALLLITGTFSVLPEFPLTKRKMRIRAGYYTEGGKYLGGIPYYNDSTQLSECVELISNSSASATTSATTTSITATDAGPEASLNATVCMRWTANTTNPHEAETGSCSCQSVAEGEYCEAWSCSQVGEVTKRCTCDTQNEDDLWTFCESRGCDERDNDDAQAFGEYRCVLPSPSAEFCEAWTGIVEGSREVGVATCECVEQWDGAGVCSYWECKDRDLDKCDHAYVGWCDIGVSVGLGGLCGSLGAAVVAWGILNMAKEDLTLSAGMLACAFGLLAMTVWAYFVLVWGGQDGIMYAGIWWGTIIACGLLRRCLAQNPAPIISFFAAGCDRMAAGCDRMAAGCARMDQSHDELDPPIPNDGASDPPIPNDGVSDPPIPNNGTVA